jgi:hypothetical protein
MLKSGTIDLTFHVLEAHAKNDKPRRKLKNFLGLRGTRLQVPVGIIASMDFLLFELRPGRLTTHWTFANHLLKLIATMGRHRQIS